MRSLGFCCGRRYQFKPQVLCCYGKQLCTIPRDVKYMSYQNKITYCMKCFSDIHGDLVTVGDGIGMDAGANAGQSINKSQFVETKNDHLDYEPFIDCKECGRKFHQICVGHFDTIWPEGFVCEPCHKSRGKKRRDNRFTAKRLPQAKLGSYIEGRVNGFLKKKDSRAGEVSIRVVSSTEKSVEVKPGMRQRYVDNGEWGESFPYRAKALFAFQTIDGTDVCFFGMHVQEYGSNCSPPNARRVYISYLDSVHFFKPKQYRTDVYQQIILGYLDYVKRIGFTMAHIWACPPTEGDDFIFHVHPVEQKIPKPKRLQEWYTNLLEVGRCEGIVIDYKNILEQATEDRLESVKELPYFDGDCWPNQIEDSIKEIEMERANRSDAGNSMDGTEQPNNGCSTKDLVKKLGAKKKSSQRKGNTHNKPKNGSVPPSSTSPVSRNAFSVLSDH